MEQALYKDFKAVVLNSDYILEFHEQRVEKWREEEGKEKKKSRIPKQIKLNLGGGWSLDIGLAPQVMGCALKVVNLLRVSSH